MSKVTKRKHVMKEMDTDFFDPPAPNQRIVRIICSRGNNLHEVELAEPIPITVTSDENPENPENPGNRKNSENIEVTTTDRFLVSMPTKFRKNVWVKRGDFVIVEPIEEGDKVKGEIVRILTQQQIKQFTKDGVWPEKFISKDDSEPNKDEQEECSDSESESDRELFRNPNRIHPSAETDSSNEDSDDEAESTDDDDN